MGQVASGSPLSPSPSGSLSAEHRLLVCRPRGSLDCTAFSDGRCRAKPTHRKSVVIESQAPSGRPAIAAGTLAMRSRMCHLDRQSPRGRFGWLCATNNGGRLCDSVPGRRAGQPLRDENRVRAPATLPGPLALSRRGLAPRRPRQGCGTVAEILRPARPRRKGFTGQPPPQAAVPVSTPSRPSRVCNSARRAPRRYGSMPRRRRILLIWE